MSFARFAATAALLAGTVAVAVPAPAGAAGSVVPAGPVVLPAAIEVMPPYQPQTFCSPVTKPGTLALAHLLTSTYAGTAIVSLTRPCGSDTSEHYDGRAIDWGVDHRNLKQRAQGKAFLQWLFASDAGGDRFAMVRRLGVMYVIWNKQIWGAYSQRWEPYSCSGVTACHVDHMHISLDWSGALKRTSFWTGKVTAPMNPPLQPLAPDGPTTIAISARQPQPPAAYKVAAGARYRFTVSGTYNDDGQRHHRADAECSTTDLSTWTTLAPGETSGRTGQLDLWVDQHHGWQPVDAPRGTCSPTHHYRQTITFAGKGPLVLSLDDPSQWGANGILTVTVTRIS